MEDPLMRENDWLELLRDGLRWRRWGNLVTVEKWRMITSPSRIRAPGAFEGNCAPGKSKNEVGGNINQHPSGDNASGIRNASGT